MARDGENLYCRGRIWYFKFRGADGKYHERSTGTAKKMEARAFRDEALARFRNGQLPTEMAKWTLGARSKRGSRRRIPTAGRPGCSGRVSVAPGPTHRPG